MVITGEKEENGVRNQFVKNIIANLVHRLLTIEKRT